MKSPRSNALVVCGVLWLIDFALPLPAQKRVPAFEMVDVHANPDTLRGMEGGPMRDGRYALHQATLADLISTAWEVRPERITGGPSWLDLDRFDVIAQAPAGTPVSSMPLMLRNVLTDRFGLKMHEDKKPLPAFVLSAGKHPLIKPADDSNDSGCRWRYLTAEQREASQPRYVCHDVTMDEFVAKLAGGLASEVGAPVVNETGLTGKWDFTLYWINKWQLLSRQEEGPSLFEAIEKELGLKLEPRDLPMDVIVVDSVNPTPTPNLAGVAEKLWPDKLRFEVASIRPAEPGAVTRGNGFEPGGRIRSVMTLATILHGAWSVHSSDMVTGVPDWFDQNRFEFIAKMPPAMQVVGAGPAPVDIAALRKMWQTLLHDRFGMVWHYEDRPADVFAMTAHKPKLRKADPRARSDCKIRTVSRGGTAAEEWTCRNLTMDQLAKKLQVQMVSFDLSHPVVNATGIEGSWDFTVTWTPPRLVASAARSMMAARRWLPTRRER
jgi:uncharacterized protein (TIGR03435 family)